MSICDECANIVGSGTSRVECIKDSNGKDMIVNCCIHHPALVDRFKKKKLTFEEWFKINKCYINGYRIEEASQTIWKAAQENHEI